MIAGRDGIHAVAKKFRCDVGRDAVATGGIFAIGNDNVEAVLLAQLGQEFLDRTPSGAAYDVADEEKFHGGILAERK